jgi:hypothetical protein
MASNGIMFIQCFLKISKLDQTLEWWDKDTHTHTKHGNIINLPSFHVRKEIRLITNFMRRSPSRAENNRPSIKEVPCIVWKLKVENGV